VYEERKHAWVDEKTPLEPFEERVPTDGWM
jgi:hypothetical protein